MNLCKFTYAHVNFIYSVAEMEFLAYLSDSSKSLAILNQYPIVKRAFSKYNAPLPSSAFVEKLFSNASMLNVPKPEGFPTTVLKNYSGLL